MHLFLKEDNRNIILFLIITFLFSWGLWFPSLLSSFGFLEQKYLFGFLRILGYFGPFIAAFSLTLYYEGMEGARILWTRGWHFGKWQYLIVALFLIPSVYLLSLWLAVITEGRNFPEIGIFKHYGFIPLDFVFFFFMTGPFQEEFGWRGYILDKFQSEWNALESSLILGGIWSLWHFPLFFMDGTPHTNQSFFNFTLAVFLLSIIFTWLYNNSNQSILITMIFHTSNNLSSSIFPLHQTLFGYAYYTLLFEFVIIFIVLIYGPKKLMRRRSIDKGLKYYTKDGRLI